MPCKPSVTVFKAFIYNVVTLSCFRSCGSPHCAFLKRDPGAALTGRGVNRACMCWTWASNLPLSNLCELVLSSNLT